MQKLPKKLNFNLVSISDTHLGTRACKEDALLEFLKTVKTDTLVLNGDIIDGWAMKRRHYWTKTQTEIIRRILKLSEKSRVIYVPGNHDEFIRPFLEYDVEYMGNIEIKDQYDYQSISGRTIVFTHGDRFDLSMKIPSIFHGQLDRVMDLFPEDFSHWLTPKIERFMSTERRARRFVEKNAEVDSVCIGHTHIPKIDQVYINSGDWVNNCTFVTEDHDGNWRLNYWKV